MKYTLAISLCILSISTFAQNVPNGGFENWETEDFYVVDDWVSYGKPSRTTEAVSGQYAIQLKNFINSGVKYIPSSIYNIDWQNGGVDKFPYDGDPLSMVFEAKYELYAGDSAELVSGFYEKGIWIGDAAIKVTGSSNGAYVKYAVPIRWYTSSRTPDSVYIGMKSTTTELAEGPGTIIIDDFRFENIGNRTVEVVNHDFENWTNKGVSYPTDWMPIDLVAFREWGGFLRNPSVMAHPTPFRGESCLAISNFVSWNDDGEGFCFTGDTTADAWRPAFAIDKKYTYLQGYYLLENGGDDTAEITLNVFRLGSYLGEGKIKFSGTSDGWQFFNIPLTYWADLVPDSATIRLVSSTNQANNSPNTVFYIDELSFVNELNNTLSVSENLKSEHTIYPNPFGNKLNITSKAGTYTIQNNLGSTIAQGKLSEGHTTINTSNLPANLYILYIQETNNNQWQTKLIKQ